MFRLLKYAIRKNMSINLHMLLLYTKSYLNKNIYNSLWIKYLFLLLPCFNIHSIRIFLIFYLKSKSFSQINFLNEEFKIRIQRAHFTV